MACNHIAGVTCADCRVDSTGTSTWVPDSTGSKPWCTHPWWLHFTDTFTSYDQCGQCGLRRDTSNTGNSVRLYPPDQNAAQLGRDGTVTVLGSTFRWDGTNWVLVL